MKEDRILQDSKVCHSMHSRIQGTVQDVLTVSCSGDTGQDIGVGPCENVEEGWITGVFFGQDEGKEG